MSMISGPAPGLTGLEQLCALIANGVQQPLAAAARTHASRQGVIDRAVEAET